MRGRGQFGGPAYEPTPEERERERQGHTDFLNKNKKELADILKKIKNANKDFKIKNEKLYAKMDRDLKKTTKMENDASKKKGLLKDLENKLKKQIKHVENIKSKIKEDNDTRLIALDKKEKSLDKQLKINRSINKESQDILNELKIEKKEIQIKKRDLISLLKNVENEKSNLRRNNRIVLDLEKEAKEELAKHKSLTKELRDKIQKQDILINKNMKLKKRLEKRR